MKAGTSPTVRALVHVRALSPLHAGTGQAADVVDLPIDRERATGLPRVRGSSFKGKLRDSVDMEEPARLALFGPEREQASEHSGAGVFGDLGLLLFPVRSATQLFLYVTSPYLLERYDAGRKEAGLSGLSAKALDVARAVRNDAARVSAKEALVGDKVWLEDHDLAGAEDPVVAALATELEARALGGAAHLTPRLAVVCDSVLARLTRSATEVVARVKIDDNAGTVERGGLWYEEALPAESVLWGTVWVGRITREKVASTPGDLLGKLQAVRHLQLGGKASVGRGLCALTWERATGGGA